MINILRNFFKIEETAAPPMDATVVSFGEPESVLAHNPARYLGVFLDSSDYYVPPVSQTGLAMIAKANAHHGRCGHFKKNLLMRDYIINDALPYKDLSRAALDYLFLGNCYFQVVLSRSGKLLKLNHLPAVRMRRKKDGLFGYIGNDDNMIEFKAGEVIHVMEYDLSQQIYGVTPWFGAVHSVLLNEDATLFRRRYYRNGAHMGFILLTMDPNLKADDEELLKKQIAASKGAGNFRSMYINIPKQGNAESAITLIPVGEMKTNNDWERIKNISRNDVMSAWGVRPELAAMLPESNGHSGDLDKIVKLNYESEIRPLQIVFEQLNDYIPGAPIAFAAPNYA